MLRAGMLLVSCFLLTAAATANEPLPQDRGSSGLLQTLRKLESTARVMHITAHPDDEDGGTLTWLSRGRGAAVTLVSITRGESGANLVTGDFFDRLGALRTVELLRAAQHYGAAVRFTRFTDFGYSKTLDETLRNWDREELLRDLVRLIRAERPHIILARFRGSPRDGHGHHQAAGLLAREAYDAAANASRFPNAGPPWQTLKLYANNYRESEDWTVTVDSGVYDPALGETYAQFARRGLRYQRSQGAGSAIAAPGPSQRYYKLVASEVGMADKEADLFDRIPPTSIAAYDELGGHIERAREAYAADEPWRSAPALARALDALRALRREHDSLDLAIKEDQLLTALEQSLGISFDALVDPDDPPQGRYSSFMPYSTFSVATPGETFHLSAHFYAPDPEKATLDRFEVLAPPGWETEPVGEGRFRVRVARDATPTSAHWSRPSVWDPAYRMQDAGVFGLPVPPAPMRVRAVYHVGDVRASVERPVQTSFVDSEGVQRRRTLVVGPAVSVAIPTEAGVLPRGRQEYEVPVQLRSNASSGVEGTLRLELPEGWKSVPGSAPFAFSREGEEVSLTFRVAAPENLTPRGFALEAVAAYGGAESRSSFERITYPGLAAVYLSHPSRHTVRVVDVNVAPNLRVGYVMGTGDDVPSAIRQLGASVELLDSEALASGDLAQYDTILLGIRAYAARPDLIAHNQRLLDYVAQGGVLVVQYNTPEYDANFGPYPYKMTRRPEEVSEQDSPMTILAPGDPVFQAPNAITAADFDGWVEQRGSKFLAEWDDRYKPLLSTHDTGQSPQRGGWLVARHGDGLYIYCAYAWYRQLPYAVPGAVRLFANLLSLGAPDANWRAR